MKYYSLFFQVPNEEFYEAFNRAFKKFKYIYTCMSLFHKLVLRKNMEEISLITRGVQSYEFTDSEPGNKQ